MRSHFDAKIFVFHIDQQQLLYKNMNNCTDCTMLTICANAYKSVIINESENEVK